jgi:SAM-dependent methyltransferase
MKRDSVERVEDLVRPSAPLSAPPSALPSAPPSALPSALPSAPPSAISTAKAPVHHHVEGLVLEASMWTHFEEQLRRLLSTKQPLGIKSVLSIGPGRYIEKASLEKVLGHRINYVGVELDERELQQRVGRTTENCHLIVGDCRLSEVKSDIMKRNSHERFDLILFRHPWKHSGFPEFCLTIIKQYLKDGGLLIFSHHYLDERIIFTKKISETISTSEKSETKMSEDSPFGRELIATPFGEKPSVLYYDRYVWCVKCHDVSTITESKKIVEAMSAYSPTPGIVGF